MTLTQPSVGSSGWVDAVNLNFQTLEQFCNGLPAPWVGGSLPEDTALPLSESNPQTGTIVYQPNNHLIRVWNGTDWDDFHQN